MERRLRERSLLKTDVGKLELLVKIEKLFN